jgi:hypothetical protein
MTRGICPHRYHLATASLDLDGSRSGSDGVVQTLVVLQGDAALLDRGHARGQPGLIARRGVLVKGALLDSFVEGGDGLAIRLFGSVLVALCDSFTKFAQLGTQARSIGAIARGSVLGLAGALQR